MEPDLVGGEYVGGKSSCRGGGGGWGEAVEYRSHCREGRRGKILLDRIFIGVDLVVEEVIGAHIIGNKAIRGGSYERAYQSVGGGGSCWRGSRQEWILLEKRPSGERSCQSLEERPPKSKGKRRGGLSLGKEEKGWRRGE